ncbi:hypothetical protein J1792_00760 [Streptomyces triculaminicus]|uniref:Secreted protein n=2 Tax=Streptomyces TaxID=1883 RepID=A0A939FHX7_9ACTN|nr:MULTISPECIES: hypothetical protein [Streptomyces]MBO0651384.1 hypothetical protein [Streptomyces triculaminicus]QSY49695.1 hypothetical protein J3S04_00755 [Streptomyces griseocarneus]
MNDDVRNIVLGLTASGISGAAGWFVRTLLWRRQLRRKQTFFGLPGGSECLLVVNQDPSASGHSVSRYDTFALLELSALIKECGANADIVAHDAARQGFGTRTEFCVGGPASNHRTEAHLRALLPGVEVNTDYESVPDGGAFTIGGQTYRMDKGRVEYVLLARLTAPAGGRPVFLSSGQRGITNQAAIRYLARHHARLARRHGLDGTFCLLLKVIGSDVYGPDMVELVADVTTAATADAAPPR